MRDEEKSNDQLLLEIILGCRHGMCWCNGRDVGWAEQLGKHSESCVDAHAAVVRLKKRLATYANSDQGGNA